jgi:two-component system, cell cycle response regulator
MNDELLTRVKACPNLPSLPAIAMQVLELAKQSDVDIAEIARIISKDPAMSGKILKTVNSSFYGRSQHVSTISHALVILGLQSVKTLVLGFSLVSNLTRSKSKGFKHLIYWKRSIFAATAARSIAAKANLVQQEEAFLAALLMDIGMLVLDLVIGEQYGAVNDKATSHNELSLIETADLGGNHAEVGGIIAEQWKLPPLLATPILNHHDAETITDPTLKRLTQIVALGSRCADVFVDEDPTNAIADVRNQLAELCGLSEVDSDALLKDIGSRTKEVATLFEINIGSVADYETILKRANEALVEITLQSQMHATELQEQNVHLKKAATTDGLTGLFNRAHFDHFMAEQFAIAQREKKLLSLLLMDVDKFKLVNDTHGHPAGDAVLRYLGKLLRSAARTQDVAARYGGEELCLVLVGTPKVTAATVAESIRRAIAAQPIPAGEKMLPITASIGVASFEPGSPFREVSHLLKAADLAVYAAKKSGRNCVRLFTLGGNSNSAAA